MGGGSSGEPLSEEAFRTFLASKHAEPFRERLVEINEIVKRANELSIGDSITFSRGANPVLRKIKPLDFEERMRLACGEFRER